MGHDAKRDGEGELLEQTMQIGSERNSDGYESDAIAEQNDKDMT